MDDAATPAGAPAGGPPSRAVTVRAIAWSDWAWLTGRGFSFRKVGSQYHWLETPLQLWIAPMRATLGPAGPAALVLVDGRRAGYIGRNPLSGNLEYFLEPWARGGVGRVAIGQFLLHHRAGDRPRFFFVAHKNERSRRALLAAFAAIGWTEDDEYRIEDTRHGWHVWVGPGPG